MATKHRTRPDAPVSESERHMLAALRRMSDRQRQSLFAALRSLRLEAPRHV